MSFKTYNNQGHKLLDSNEAVFSFVKSGRLTRLLATPFENNKRKYWYRAKRMIINSEMREGRADIHTAEYCMYYIDLPNAISPIAGVYYDGLASECNPVIYLNTGYFDGMARMMFYSNGRLSDEELNKFQIYIFDVNVIKETQVGINLYDSHGNITFSSQSKPMNIITKTVNQDIPDNIKYITADEAKILNLNVAYDYDLGDYYYDGISNNDKALIEKRLNYGNLLSEILPTISTRCAGLQLFKIKPKAYPKNTSELSIAFGSFEYSNDIPVIAEEGGRFPVISIGKYDTVEFIGKRLSYSYILVSIGCKDKSSIIPSVDYSDINKDSSPKEIDKQELLRRKLVFDDEVVSFGFVDITNLPFPYN